MRSNPDIHSVKAFWESNPLCAAAIPHQLGTKQYFDYYDQLRESSESIEFSYSLHEYKQFAGQKVLDIGCGNGYVLSRYAMENAIVYGIDITETGIALCEKRFELLGLQDRATFRVANAEELPFDDCYFDCVCSMGVLHHVPNTEKAVSEIYRVLKPGGRVITMFYHRNSALYQLKFRIDALRKNKTIHQLVNEVDGIGNPKGDVYSRKELYALFRDFVGIEMFVGSLEHWMVPFGKYIPHKILNIVERYFGWFLYAKARKTGNR